MAEEGGGLDLLIHKATNPQNQSDDVAAIEQFCRQVDKEVDGPQIAARLIAHKVQSPQEREALQGLAVLDACVRMCGSSFHAEIGKFRFLNELIKVVSPKYLGRRSSPCVKERVVELMYSWTIDIRNESKIKEAYEMLKKQGVVKDDPRYVGDRKPATPPPQRPKNPIFEDEERSRQLQKLLQSRNPEDLQAANRLIKSMVKEDEKRMERISRRVSELETVHNNVKVLNDMLDNYQSDTTSTEELEVMRELYQSCQKLRPNLFRLAADTDEKDDALGDIFKASDEVGRAIERYEALAIHGKSSAAKRKPSEKAKDALLDLDVEGGKNEKASSSAILEDQLCALGLNDNASVQSRSQNSLWKASKSSELDDLGEIFKSGNAGAASPLVLSLGSESPLLPRPANPSNRVPAVSLIPSSPTFTPPTPAPTSLMRDGPKESWRTARVFRMQSAKDLDLLTCGYLYCNDDLYGSEEFRDYVSANVEAEVKTSRMTGLEELDALGESLLRESLPSSFKPGAQFPKPPEKIPLNQLPKQSVAASLTDHEADADASDLDLLSRDVRSKDPRLASLRQSGNKGDLDLLTDDVLLDLSMSPKPRKRNPKNGATESEKAGAEPGEPVKPSSLVDDRTTRSKEDAAVAHKASLAKVFVALESIQPGDIPPLTVIQEKNGMSVTLHFARDSPREDVSVIVVSTVSNNSLPVSDYLFQAVVPKTCKVKLQPPSGTELPAHNPFLPPPAITQVMLISNPLKSSISLKLMISYMADGELVTEMGEVDELPVS